MEHRNKFKNLMNDEGIDYSCVSYGRMLQNKGKSYGTGSTIQSCQNQYFKYFKNSGITQTKTWEVTVSRACIVGCLTRCAKPIAAPKSNKGVTQRPSQQQQKKRFVGEKNDASCYVLTSKALSTESQKTKLLRLPRHKRVKMLYYYG